MELSSADEMFIMNPGATRRRRMAGPGHSGPRGSSAVTSPEGWRSRASCPMVLDAPSLLGIRPGDPVDRLGCWRPSTRSLGSRGGPSRNSGGGPLRQLGQPRRGPEEGSAFRSTSRRPGGLLADCDCLRSRALCLYVDPAHAGRRDRSSNRPTNPPRGTSNGSTLLTPGPNAKARRSSSMAWAGSCQALRSARGW